MVMGFGCFNLVHDRDPKERVEDLEVQRPDQGWSLYIRVGLFVPRSVRLYQVQPVHFQAIEIFRRILYGVTCYESNQDLFLVTEIFLILK